MSVQHQQSEWVECRYSILFLTLYQGDWLDKRNECVSIQRHFALVDNDASFMNRFCSFTLNTVFFWFTLIDTEWRKKKRKTIWCGHNFLTTLLNCVQMKTKVRMQIYGFADHFHVTFWVSSSEVTKRYRSLFSCMVTLQNVQSSDVTID